jgi:hypothetical protein
MDVNVRTTLEIFAYAKRVGAGVSRGESRLRMGHNRYEVHLGDRATVNTMAERWPLGSNKHMSAIHIQSSTPSHHLGSRWVSSIQVEPSESRFFPSDTATCPLKIVMLAVDIKLRKKSTSTLL